MFHPPLHLSIRPEPGRDYQALFSYILTPNRVRFKAQADGSFLLSSTEFLEVEEFREYVETILAIDDVFCEFE